MQVKHRRDGLPIVQLGGNAVFLRPHDFGFLLIIRIVDAGFPPRRGIVGGVEIVLFCNGIRVRVLGNRPTTRFLRRNAVLEHETSLQMSGARATGRVDHAGVENAAAVNGAVERAARRVGDVVRVCHAVIAAVADGDGILRLAERHCGVVAKPRIGQQVACAPGQRD